MTYWTVRVHAFVVPNIVPSQLESLLMGRKHITQHMMLERLASVTDNMIY